jgi:hypothetical protein
MTNINSSFTRAQEHHPTEEVPRIGMATMAGPENSSTAHQPPEHQPLQDAKRHLLCAQSALRAAVHCRPDFAPEVDCVNTLLADAAKALEGLK